MMLSILNVCQQHAERTYYTVYTVWGSWGPWSLMDTYYAVTKVITCHVTILFQAEMLVCLPVLSVGLRQGLLSGISSHYIIS